MPRFLVPFTSCEGWPPIPPMQDSIVSKPLAIASIVFSSAKGP